MLKQNVGWVFLSFFRRLEEIFALCFRFLSSPDSKDIKIQSVLNKRFLFVSRRVTERLHWFSVVTIVNSGLHLGRLIKQKTPFAVNNHTAQRSPIPRLYPEEMVQTRNTTVTIHRPGNSSRVSPFSGLVAREQHLYDTFGLALPPRPQNIRPFLRRASHSVSSSSLLGESSSEAAHQSTIPSRPQNAR